MAYPATVIPIMIASPGDVFEEREIIREVIHTWNYINSLSTKVVLMPTGWETHSSPELGTRAQELINTRLLKECDILVAVFWTRLGTPTGKAESGTVEEIEEHVKLKKPALIYFSSKPAAPETVDKDQIQALQRFKTKCKEWGLIEEFDNIVAFRDKVQKQLQICLNSNEYIKKLVVPTSQNIPSIVQVRRSTESYLSEHAKALLKAASKDEHGQILYLNTMGGRFLQAGGQSFGGQIGRESAKWEQALKLLSDYDLIIPRGHKGEVYELTDRGWSAADNISD
jgi:hypothetical protein